MGRAVSIAVVVAGLAAAGAGLLPAQEIFWDGFESDDLCGWSNPPALYLEQEAFDDSGANDSVANAELIPTRCAVVEGTIGVPYDDEPGPDVVLVADTDFYELSLEGPALVGIRLERFGEGSELEPYAELSNSSEYSAFPWAFAYFPDALPADDPVLTSRQVYLPENGFAFLDPSDPEFGSKDIPANNRWFLLVDDNRNFYDGSCPCGGETNRYRLTITIETVAGPPVGYVYVDEPIVYPADGSVLRYRVGGPGVTTLDLTETILDQLNPGYTDLDTKLFLVKKVGSSLQTVKGDDDWAVDLDGYLIHTDSRIGSTALTTDPHFVVVDYFSRYGNDPIDLGLTIQFLQTLWP